MELGFISSFDNKDRKLSDFAENVEIHFAVKKKIEILGKARKLLLRCDFSLPRVSSLAEIPCVVRVPFIFLHMTFPDWDFYRIMLGKILCGSPMAVFRHPQSLKLIYCFSHRSVLYPMLLYS